MNLHKKHLNGILADETGLGKTVQTVAYMAHLAGQEGIILDLCGLLFNECMCLFYVISFFPPQASGDPILLS